MPATASPKNALPTSIPNKESTKKPEVPEIPYNINETMRTGLRPNLSSRIPANGDPSAMNKAGIVKVSMTKNSAFGTS